MANIIFGIYLGFICVSPENQSFLQEKQPNMYIQGTHSAKVVLIVWPKTPQMTQKIAAQNVCPSPKAQDFLKKALSGCPQSVLAPTGPIFMLQNRSRNCFAISLSLTAAGCHWQASYHQYTTWQQRFLQKKPETL